MTAKPTATARLIWMNSIESAVRKRESEYSLIIYTLVRRLGAPSHELQTGLASYSANFYFVTDLITISYKLLRKLHKFLEGFRHFCEGD